MFPRFGTPPVVYLHPIPDGTGARTGCASAIGTSSIALDIRLPRTRLGIVQVNLTLLSLLSWFGLHSPCTQKLIVELKT